ncbi:MAG: bile acid:sodium symporter family protein [Muribaculaceae bacterium]
MKIALIQSRLKPWMLPIAMVVGVFCHNVIDAVAGLAPVLIFVMLLITFCKIEFRQFHITAMTWWLLGVQILGSVAAYFALLPVNPVLAQGAFICIFCPTATAAPVITAMLGGSIQRLVTYSLVSNAVVAATAPMLFTMMGGDVGFMESTVTIAAKVLPLILGPLAVAILLKHTVPGVHRVLAQKQGISFYIWALSLIIVVGRAVSFMLKEPADCIPLMIALAAISLIVCGIQFIIGRRIGARFGDKIAGAQGLGQKNTVLAIWMAIAYLNPIASVAPAAYVAWQNIINSTQIYYKMRATSAAVTHNAGK